MMGQAIKAAQYVRMSTDKQIYSTANQAAAIGLYAVSNGFEVVSTYSDEGRSGLRIKGRDALQAMLHDVLAPERPFDAILVYDISRWGRFQDTDESAYYEFLCRRAGVQVHYCAEPFENDGSPTASIMKGLRRLMAGEFSRDLSEKVWVGQSRLVSMGFKMGGQAGYGLHRLLVDRDGNPKQILRKGERKSISTDRVVLTPGDPREVAVVRRIFRLAAGGMSNPDIARALNDDRIPAPTIDTWSNHQVRQIIKSERYLGTSVYNRQSSKLGGRRVANEEADWVRRERAFEPIISSGLFMAAQSKDRAGRPDYADGELLDHLRKLWSGYGFLNSKLIRSAAPPACKTYSNRFGSLLRAYARIGYDASKRGNIMKPSAHQLAIATDAAEWLRAAGSQVTMTSTGQFLTVDAEIIIAPRAVEFHPTKAGGHWPVRRSKSTRVDLVLVGLMRNGQREHLYLLPVDRFGRSGKIEIGEKRRQFADYEVWNPALLPEMIRALASRRQPV
jgi:DNA invertase Pin-like site-specific DNA recombinase